MKSNQKLTVLFWVRKSKATKDGFAPLYARITIDGQDEELSVGRKVHPDDWDVENKLVKGGAEAKITNKKMAEVSSDLETHFNVLRTLHEDISPQMLKNVYNNLPAILERDTAITLLNQATHGKFTPEYKLLQSTDIFISEFEQKVMKGIRSKETLKQWRATRKKIAAFIKYKFETDDILLSEVEYDFALEFYDYLTIYLPKNLQEAAAKKQLKNTKQVLYYAEMKRWVFYNPIKQFKCGGDETDILPLELFQVESIYLKKNLVSRLEEVRDAFIFQCFTGFAYQDIYGLTPEHIIHVGQKRERWLVKKRGKTEIIEIVPILPIIDEIITKYKNHPFCKANNVLLPINSNERYNGYLKELAVICGIDRELNTHLARHTFADIMLNLGVSLEVLSKMLGHKSIRTTQRYAKIRKDRIAEEMEKVKSKLFTKLGKLKKISMPSAA